MSKYVRILNGSYRGEMIEDTVFPLIRELKIGKKKRFVTVDGSSMFGPSKVRIPVKVSGINDIEYIDTNESTDVDGITVVEPQEETVEDAIIRIRERFAVLEEMTTAVALGHVRGMIVTGPPGVGKSFGVDASFKKAEFISRMSDNRRFDVEEHVTTVTGAMSPIGLYKILYENRQYGSVLVLDDCDSVLFDETSLNLLKAALDSTKKRRLFWNTESRVLANEEVPKTFDFEGSVIFITNLKFDHKRRSKISDHLDAILSRCHYMDLALDSIHDCILRCRQIVGDGMLRSYGFELNEEQEIMQFVEDNADRMREISLRMITKIADLKRMQTAGSTDWRRLAEMTCMKRHVV